MDAKGLLFLDAEWANPKNKSLCQIGFIYRDLDTGSEEERSILIDPRDEFDEDFVAVHSIDASKVEGCPDFPQVWQEIYHYFDDSVVVGYNLRGGALDAIQRNLSRYGIAVPTIRFIDTISVAERNVDKTEIINYSRPMIHRFFDIISYKIYKALDDAKGCRSIYDRMAGMEHIDMGRFVEVLDPSGFGRFTPYCSTIEINRRISTLYGIIRGICIDGVVTEDERGYLSEWSDENEGVRSAEELGPLMDALDAALVDETVSPQTLEAVNASLNAYILKQRMGREVFAMQELQGIVIGIQCDHRIDPAEMLGLKQWMYDNGDLAGTSPYDQVFRILKKTTSSNTLEESDREDILRSVGDVFDPLKSVERQLIVFEGKAFSLSGNFLYGPKEKVQEYLESKGAKVHTSVKKSTNYLVVGDGEQSKYNDGYGTKTRKAEELGITILKECQIFDE